MKLIAIETATGKQFPVSNAEFDLDGNIKRVDSFKIDCDNIIITHIDIPAEATLHVSTGMLDKNGREILVGNRLRGRTGDEWKVTWDGKQWSIFWTMNPVLLTTEIAATMEVVE